jgi:hypothetical protein
LSKVAEREEIVRERERERERGEERDHVTSLGAPTQTRPRGGAYMAAVPVVIKGSLSLSASQTRVALQ